VAAPVHRMKLSVRRNSRLVVWCTCMAQVNDQVGHPSRPGDPAAPVPWRFWGFDYLAVIPINQPAGPVFRQHVLESTAKEATAA
jgi:hypothetical protein